MIVPSLVFLIFACIGALFYNLSQASRWREGVFFVVNLGFMATYSSNPLAFAPYLAFLALGFVWVQVLSRARSRVLFLTAIGSTLLLFCWLKRYAFIPAQTFVTAPIVTVGLSYVFFRVMHLIIDAAQDSIERPVKIVPFFNYAMNFTSIVSGPIQRFQDYSQSQYHKLPALDRDTVIQAFERILLGFFKVLVVSAILHSLQIFAISRLDTAPPGLGTVPVAMAIVSVYPLYLYFNFSGYVDVVIGTARLYRLPLPENFNNPFSSANFIIFWSRWHITLSNWLKTYIYNPLLMEFLRHLWSVPLEPYIAVAAFFVTFFLVGAWHGQTSEFLFFGVLQGGGVAGNKLYQIAMARWLGRNGYKELSSNPRYATLCRGACFTWFAFTLLWFWSNWEAIADLGGRLGAQGVLAAVAISVLAASAVLAALVAIQQKGANIGRSVFWRTALASTQLVLLMSMTVLLESPAPGIVYKEF